MYIFFKFSFVRNRVGFQKPTRFTRPQLHGKERVKEENGLYLSAIQK
jgi:hypothetical protein